MPSHRVHTGVQRIGGVPAQVSRENYRLGDGDRDFEVIETSSDTYAASGDARYEQVAEMELVEGLGVMFGRGTQENPLQAQAFIGIAFSDGASPPSYATGKYRIAVRTTQGRRLYNAHEGTLEEDNRFDEDDEKKDRQNLTPLPQTMQQFETEPRKITIDVDVDDDINIDWAGDETEVKIEGWLAESLR